MTTPALNGVYRLDLPPEELPTQLVPVLDGRGLADKDELLAALGRALDFPDYYGGNWDALEECLHDATLPAGLCIDRCGIPESADPESWAILLDILAVVAEDWQAVDQPFSVFLRGGHAAWPLISS